MSQSIPTGARAGLTVAGAGLAGCEAALAAANAGVPVRLVEMKPDKYTPAHHSPAFAELVCSNSLKASRLASAAGLLKEEMARLGSACVAAFTAGVRIKMFVISPFESLGMAMATYTGHNYGAVKPERIWQGIKVAAGLMLGYALFAFVVLMAGSDLLARLFIDPSQSEILADTRLFLHVASYFLPVLGLLCILRYTIQGAGYTNLAMLSGVSEMIARTAVSLWAVPAVGYIAVCVGDPTAWIAADLLLVPAFVYVYGPVSYTPLPLPTKRIVLISLSPAYIQNKKTKHLNNFF